MKGKFEIGFSDYNLKQLKFLFYFLNAIASNAFIPHPVHGPRDDWSHKTLKKKEISTHKESRVYREYNKRKKVQIK